MGKPEWDDGASADAEPAIATRDVIAIAGSLGSIEAAKTLLARLPESLPAAVFIVIHVGSRGLDLLSKIFGQSSTLPVSTAVDGEMVRHGHVYVAPAGSHMVVMGDVIRLGRGPRENLCRPAADPLFRSIAVSYGPRAVGVVLTGLLNDGAAGLSAIERCGGATAVQSPSDAAAPDMPLAALAALDVGYRGTAAELADVLIELVTQQVEPEFQAPADLELEVEIALGRRSDADTTLAVGDVTPLSCPSCGGVLSRMRTGSPLRFRCQVGHAYTAEVLAKETEGSVDEAIRTALRIVGERRVLLGKMAAEEVRAGRDTMAAHYRDRCTELQEHETTLRRAALPAGPGGPSNNL